MHTIKTTVNITDDRKLVLELPQEIMPGEHRVVVVFDEPSAEEDVQSETPVRWIDGLLVYDGEVVGPVDNVLDAVREERMRHILGDARP